MSHTQEEIFQTWKKQPDNVRAFIVSVEASNILGRISEQYALSSQQREELASESLLLLIQLTQENEFVPNLIARLKIRQDIAQKIAVEIKERIIKRAPTFSPTYDDEVSDEQNQDSQKVTAPKVVAPKTAPPPANLPELPEEHRLAIKTIETGAIKTPTTVVSTPLKPQISTSQPPVQTPQKVETAPAVKIPVVPQTPQPISRPLPPLANVVPAFTIPTPKKESNILDTRLGTSHNLPHEVVEIKKTPEPIKLNKQDPYREPIA